MTGWQVDKMTIWQYDKIRDSNRKTLEFRLEDIDLFGRRVLPPRNQGTRNSHLNSPWTTAPSALDDRKPPAASPGITHQTITRCTLHWSTTGSTRSTIRSTHHNPLSHRFVNAFNSPLGQVLGTITSQTTVEGYTGRRSTQQRYQLPDFIFTKALFDIYDKNAEMICKTEEKN